MADWELVEDRLISGKGLLRVPEGKKKNRAAMLYVEVIRPPKNKYLNFNYNPPRSRYATMCFFRKGYLVDTRAVEFPKEVFDTVNDICGQTLIAVKCAYDGILKTFENLAIALSQTPGGIGLTYEGTTDLIADYENLRLAWDEIKVQCYADTAIQLRLYRLVYDVCDPDKDKDKEPPDPPPPHPPVPPGEPIHDLSDPYDGDNDSGDTEPYPDDGSPPPPGGDPCVKYRVYYEFDTTGFGATNTTFRYAIAWGVIGELSYQLLGTGGTTIRLNCQGIVKVVNAATGDTLSNQNEVCGAAGNRTVDQVSFNSDVIPVTRAEITSIVEEP